MADVASTLVGWSSTTASNAPAGATTIGTGLDDNLREIQGVVVRGLSHKGSDIASAATADLGAVEGLMHDITGTTTITSFGTVRAGILKVVKFEGALTLTHNATSLILPGGASITTADGDVAIVISEGSGNWRCLSYFKAANSPMGAVLGTEQATTSGTSVDFTGIPSWVKEIQVMLEGVSGSGTSVLMLQLGDSGGVETTGYTAGGMNIASGGTGSVTTSTAGFPLTGSNAATTAWRVVATLTLKDSSDNTWAISGTCYDPTNSVVGSCSGTKALSATLDRVRLTHVNGTDTFDAGSVNILYR